MVVFAKLVICRHRLMASHSTDDHPRGETPDFFTPHQV